MNKTISDVRSELEQLEVQKEKIKEQLILMSDNVNQKNQELRNMLSAEFVGKFVKKHIKDNISYGIIHSIVGIDTVKVMNVGFTINNKIDRTCELIAISDLEFVSESEVASHIFNIMSSRYEEWRGADE